MSNEFEGIKFCLIVHVRKQEIAKGVVWRAYCQCLFATVGCGDMAFSTTLKIISIPPGDYDDVLCAALEYATRHNAIFEGVRND